MQQQRGFTLIELVVTLVVAGIILVVGVPNFRDLIQRNRVATEVNRFISHVQFARSESIRRGATVTLCQSGTLALCGGEDNAAASGVYEKGWLVYADRSGPSDNYDSTEDVLLRVADPAPGDLTMRADGNGARWLSFGSRGEFSGLHAQLAFCHDGVSTTQVPGRLVTVHATGRTTLEAIAAGGSCTP